MLPAMDGRPVVGVEGGKDGTQKDAPPTPKDPGFAALPERQGTPCILERMGLLRLGLHTSAPCMDGGSTPLIIQDPAHASVSLGNLLFPPCCGH